VVPVPVPVFVPIPLHLYTQYAPVPFGIPVPVSNHLRDQGGFSSINILQLCEKTFRLLAKCNAPGSGCFHRTIIT
jgi:hypothetical protein